jgi:hypothetical protein
VPARATARRMERVRGTLLVAWAAAISPWVTVPGVWAHGTDRQLPIGSKPGSHPVSRSPDVARGQRSVAMLKAKIAASIRTAAKAAFGGT